MTSIQIKAEIDKLLNEIPDEALQSVLDLLNEIETQPAEKTRLAANIKKPMTEEKAPQKVSSMIGLKTVIEAHAGSIDNFGDGMGIRNWEGALNRQLPVLI